MAGEASGYVGNIPQHYDQDLGPLLFTDYAADIAQRVATFKPHRVLETAAGTGIVTRALRDALPAGASLTATDLNAPMLDIGAKKFRPGEAVEFRTADATALPFTEASFDAIVCQFGVMFFPDKDKSYREAFRALAGDGHYVFSIWDSHRHNPIGKIAHEVIGSFFPTDPPQFQSVPFAYRFEQIKEFAHRCRLHRHQRHRSGATKGSGRFRRARARAGLRQPDCRPGTAAWRGRSATHSRCHRSAISRCLWRRAGHDPAAGNHILCREAIHSHLIAFHAGGPSQKGVQETDEGPKWSFATWSSRRESSYVRCSGSEVSRALPTARGEMANTRAP